MKLMLLARMACQRQYFSTSVTSIYKSTANIPSDIFSPKWVTQALCKKSVLKQKEHVDYGKTTVRPESEQPPCGRVE